MFPTLVLAAVLSTGADPEAEKVLIDIRLLSGDPLGSRAEGTLKHLSEPKLVTQSGRPAFFRSGGQRSVVENGETKMIHVGPEVELLATVQKDGKVKLEMTAKQTDFVDEEKVVVSRSSTRTVEFGTTFKKRLMSDAQDKQLWVEVTVRKPETK